MAHTTDCLSVSPPVHSFERSMTGTSRSSELCAHTDALSSSTSTNISGSFIEPCRIAEINTALVSEPELAANMAARSEVAGSLVDGICCIPMMAATNPSGLKFNKTKKNTRIFLIEACSCALGSRVWKLMFNDSEESNPARTFQLPEGYQKIFEKGACKVLELGSWTGTLRYSRLLWRTATTCLASSSCRNAQSSRRLARGV